MGDGTERKNIYILQYFQDQWNYLGPELKCRVGTLIKSTQIYVGWVSYGGVGGGDNYIKNKNNFSKLYAS